MTNIAEVNMNIMKKVLYGTILLLSPAIYSAEERFSYGKAGGLEMSTGISMANTGHYKSDGYYQLALLPYVNHFVLNRLFLRYDLGSVFQYSSYGTTTQGTYESWAISLRPGLGIGYSFQFNENWFLNISGGYQHDYTWYYSTLGGADGAGSGQIVFSPELKYLVTANWLLTIRTNIATNLIRLAAVSNESLLVVSSTYIVASYYLP